MTPSRSTGQHSTLSDYSDYGSDSDNDVAAQRLGPGHGVGATGRERWGPTPGAAWRDSDQEEEEYEWNASHRPEIGEAELDPFGDDAEAQADFDRIVAPERQRQGYAAV